MTPVFQRNGHDCFLAALATVLQRSYESLWTPDFVEKVIRAGGAGHEERKEAFAIAGLAHNVDYKSIYAQHLGEDGLNLLWGRRAILSVPSLNNQGHHAVAWMYDTLYDPNPEDGGNYRYRWKHQLKLGWVHIFNERQPEEKLL